MATVRIRLGDLGAVPAVCVKTGVATDERIDVPVDYVPVLLTWAQTLGFWSFVFARAGRDRRHRIGLPVTTGAARRARRWRRASVAVVVGAAALAVVAALTQHPLAEAVATGGAAAGVVIGSRMERRLWIRCRIDRRGRTVTVAGCHPAFACALPPPGPSGRARRGGPGRVRFPRRT